MKTICLIFFACLLSFSCNKETLDAGPEESRTLQLISFNTVQFESIFDVQLVQDTMNFVVFTCGKNLIDNVYIRVEDNIIHFDQKAVTNWARTYKHTLLELHFTQLDKIQINNSIKLQTKKPIECSSLEIYDLGELSEVNLNVNCSNLVLAVGFDNSSIYRIYGNATNTSFSLNGSAHFYTENLVSENCSFNHDGIGDLYVNATNFLSGKILKKGLVKYISHFNLHISIENINGKVTTIDTSQVNY